ncbi:MAG: cobalt transporter CbiM [Deltaproteobacteria bacterium]|nr:MAG: cobalt transporter CbiM [Deltaproteobacteria bacterium]
MHISEGVLSAPVLLTGAVLTATGVAVGLKKMKNEQLPLVGVLSSAFFVSSLIHIPVGPSAVHLVLNGLLGLLLGWVAFPAILVGVSLQALIFQFGGLTTLGVNTFNMAMPAILCYYLFARHISQDHPGVAMVLAFGCGFVAILLSAILVALSLIFTGESFVAAAKLLVVAHLPVMVVEAVVSALSLGFLMKVRPEILGVPHAT